MEGVKRRMYTEDKPKREKVDRRRRVCSVEIPLHI
jgi:hypothetical protein